jgi:hypothetical protein
MELINYWSIVINMVISVVLGFIWYGPLFGKKWMELSGIKMPDQKPSASVMVKPIILSLIGAFFLNYALSVSIAFHNAYYVTAGIPTALAFAFLLWLGFIIPPYLNLSGWEGKPWTLFFINTCYWLVYLLISAAIIASFI